MDGPSPLGFSWNYTVMALSPLLVVAALVLAVVSRRALGPWTRLVLVLSVLAATWTPFAAGASVKVPIPEDPDGAECVATTWAPVDWRSDCGRAFAMHLTVAAVPSLTLLLVCIWGVAIRALGKGTDAQGPAVVDH